MGCEADHSSACSVALKSKRNCNCTGPTYALTATAGTVLHCQVIPRFMAHVKLSKLLAVTLSPHDWDKTVQHVFVEVRSDRMVNWPYQ
jgi:hypothetical protein